MVYNSHKYTNMWGVLWLKKEMFGIFILTLFSFIIGCSKEQTDVYKKDAQVNNVAQINSGIDNNLESNKLIKVVYAESSSNEKDQKIKEQIDKTIGFQRDLTTAIFESMNVDYDLEKLPSDNDVYTAILRGDADTAFGYQQDPVNKEIDYSYSYMYAIVDFGSFEYSGYHSFIVKKGNSEVLDIINDGINKIKENGDYGRIYVKYFGDDNSRSILNK